MSQPQGSQVAPGLLQPGEAILQAINDGVAEENDSEDDSDQSSYCTDSIDESEKMWEENAESLWDWESSFQESRQYHCYSNEILYDFCTAAELKRFVRDRRLTDPFAGGTTLKYIYLKALLKADSQRRFRFMDLPPEMRNMVFRFLLVWPDNTCLNHRHAFPQILRTCQRNYTEGQSILYSQNLIKATFWADTCEPWPLAGLVVVHSDVFDFTEDANQGNTLRLSKVGFGEPKLPRFLKLVQRLEITLGAHSCYSGLPRFRKKYLGGCLLNFISFLMDGHHLRQLTVCADAKGSQNLHRDVSTLMHHISRLRNIPYVYTKGNVAPELLRYLTCKIRSSEPAFNIVKQFNLLNAEATAYSVLNNTMSQSLKGVAKLSPDSRDPNRILAALAEVRSLLLEYATDAEDEMETKIWHQYSKLQKQLNDASSGEMSKAILQWAEKHKTRTIDGENPPLSSPMGNGSGETSKA